jgi:hypothetical protein
MKERTDTQSPLRVSFQGDADEQVHRFIVEQAEALERLYGAFTYCHVIVEAPEVRDGRYGASLFLTMPDDVEVCVDCHGPLDDRFCDPRFAVSEAFRRAQRLIASRSGRHHGGAKIMHDEITGEASRLGRRHP